MLCGFVSGLVCGVPVGFLWAYVGYVRRRRAWFVAHAKLAKKNPAEAGST